MANDAELGSPFENPVVRFPGGNVIVIKMFHLAWINLIDKHVHYVTTALRFTIAAHQVIKFMGNWRASSMQICKF